MSLQIGALGSSPASLIHTWQQINLSTLFRRSVSLPLGIEIHSCECSYLHVSLRMNSPMCVHNVSSLEWGGEESVKRNERPGATRSHFMSLQTGTLDSRSLAYFSCHPAAKSDYYLTVLGEWALVGFFFPLPVCSRLDVTECFRMHAAAGGRGGRICLGLIVLPLCNQERLIWGDGRFPDPIINNWAHFHD